MSFPPIPDRGSRTRNAFNQLTVLAAVFGIGASGWGLWLEREEYEDRQASRERITEACAGLVNPDRVLGLNGGTARAISGSGADDSFTFDSADSLPGRCVIYRVGAPGTSYGHFALTVRTNPGDTAANVVGNPLRPFEERIFGDVDVEDVTREADHAPEYPLDYPAEDDGGLGHYDDDSATFKVTCASAKDGVTSVNVRTEADYDDVSFQDLQTVIELAAGAAYEAAERVGCTPDGPLKHTSFPRLWIPDAKLKEAASAEGSCRWYAESVGGLPDDAGLPDRARPAPVGEHSFKESCLLAASPAQVKKSWPEVPRSDFLRLDQVLTHSPWWLQTDSFFGDEAREVVAQAFGGDRTSIRPGTAGGGLGAVWWASSTCDGEPAVHTISVSSSYADTLAPSLRALFRSYVDRITARRDCTDIKFPTPAALPSA